MIRNTADSQNGERFPARAVSIVTRWTPEILERVSGLLRRRGYRVQGLSVALTEDPQVGRLLVMLDEGDRTEQVVKNLHKLAEVTRVHDISDVPVVRREMAMIKINVTPGNREEVLHVTRVFRGRVVDISERTMTVEISGKSAKVDALQKMLGKFGIREMVRTGPLALARGEKST